jgi:cytochrome c oxidase subunit 2
MWNYSVGSDETDALGRPIIRVPQGAEVTFIMTSADVQHGFLIEQHNVNLQILPGQVARQTVSFPTTGTFHAICHEYCGRGHQGMGFSVIVEPASS